MQLPKLTPIRAERQIINKFSGYNHNPVILDGANRYAYGEWYDCSGLTTDEYPTAAVRKPHGGMSLLGSGFVTGLFVARGKIGYTRGSYIYFYTGALSDNGYSGYDLGLDNNAKQIISMGAYRIILPDYKYINVEDPVNDKGDMYGTALLYNKQDSGGQNCTGFFVNLCDEEGTDLDLSGDPSDPVDGQYFLNTITLVLSQYNAALDEWQVVEPTYLKIGFTGLPATGSTPLTEASFDDGEMIRILWSGVSSGAAINYGSLPSGDYKFVKKDRSYVVIEAKPARFSYLYFEMRVEHGIPKMDHVFECENRLWGCRCGTSAFGTRVNEIYASQLGNFRRWESDEGNTSMSGYTVSVGTDGPFTGACAFGGKPIFFKENVMHRVYGSYPAQYQIQTTEVQGVEKGAWRSLATVNNVLYYKSRAGIMAYDGASPVTISAPLGTETYKNASAGGHKTKYFVTMMKEDEEYVTFIYDAARRLWEKHDNVSGLSADFGAIWQSCGDEMYATIIDTAFSTMREWYGTDNADGSPVEWYAETGDLGLDSPDRKRVTRLTLRMKMNVGSLVKVFIKYDDGEWEQQSVTAGYSLRSYSLPIRVKRCDHFRLRFEGMGYCQIYSITRTIEGGSDL